MRTAVVVGAGPAGLTAAHELLARTDVRPLVLEMGDVVGGLCRTVVHAGNRIDIGGHRFFSKSDRVMRWWLARMPLQRLDPGAALRIGYQGGSHDLGTADGEGPDPDVEDRVMLVRSRKSRIFHRGRLYDYPLRFGVRTLRNLGAGRTARIAASYARARAFPVRNERSLEDFLVNRFGRELYRTFFESYTEKVWGVPCTEISAAWGAQRIKGLSVAGAVRHALRRALGRGSGGIGQKGTETSLIERFLYPKFGPGQMWDTVAGEVVEAGGEVRHGWRCEQVLVGDGRVRGVRAVHLASGERTTIEADFVISTMPVRHLLRALGPSVPGAVRDVGEGLRYRDFLTVGLLVDELLLRGEDGGRIRDNWLYVQEPAVRLGRLQVFDNWSPYMVADPERTWLGLEYFCDDTDDVWRADDAALQELGARELERIGLVRRRCVRDGTVVRAAKAYPAYFGTYDRMGEVRAFLDAFPNLFPVGRNGMHRYNNQDHSMLTAMISVDRIADGRSDKSDIWAVNTEEDYHEQ